MSVRLRLMRFGKRNRPCYRLCVVDSRAPRDGAYIESIGSYDPFIEDDRKKVQVNKERAEHWLSVGASPSDTVASFLRASNVSGIVRAKKPAKRRPKSAKAKARLKGERAEKKAGKRASRKKLKAAARAKKAAGDEKKDE